ncbi:MAG: hypothetical protein ACO1NQ_12575 [Flavobacteriales bacterium]
MRTLLTNWDLVRVIRALLALVFLATGILREESVALFAAALLGAQAVLNIGCSGGACTPATGTDVDVDNTGITCEEIHAK